MKKNILLIILFLSSCSIEKIAVKKTSDIIDNGTKTIFSEPNIEYIKQALPSNLKLMEMLYQTDKNPKLIKNLTMGFCGYAFAFLDDNRPYANSFYKKGILYSDDYIKEKNILNKKKLSNIDFDILFWNTFCKSSYLDLNKDNIEALDYLNEIETNAQKLFDINPNYFNGSLYSLLAVIYASKPSLVGGDIKKAENYFNKAFTYKDFLINKYLYLKTIPVIIQDEELFDNTIKEIEDYEIKEDENIFFNKIAKIKTKKLKEMKNELF